MEINSNVITGSCIILIFIVAGLYIFGPVQPIHEERMEMRCYDKAIIGDGFYIIFTDSDNSTYRYHTTKTDEYVRVNKNNTYYVNVFIFDNKIKIHTLGEEVKK